MALSPMMRQYLEIKEQNPDCILFFRLGDFYEMFFEDAKTVSRELELTLTGKSCGLEERAPMCGVPYHSADTYIARLIEKGMKVAICEQMEDPATTKGLVKRAVVQIVTPGTLTSQNMLTEDENNYLATVYADRQGIGLCYCDISTGEIYVSAFSGVTAPDTLLNELVRIHAREININEGADRYIDKKAVERSLEVHCSILENACFSHAGSVRTIKRQYGITSMEDLGLEDNKNAVSALGATIAYLLETQKRSISHLARPEVYTIGSYMALDRSTIRNLELTETLYEKRRKGSLLGVLDKTGETAAIIAISSYGTTGNIAAGNGFVLDTHKATGIDSTGNVGIHHMALAGRYIVTTCCAVAQLACEAANAAGAGCGDRCIGNIATLEG